MPGKFISFETACRHLVKNNAADGAIIARVLYWYPKAKLKRGGKRWIADVRIVWAFDCGLTVKSFDLAVERLVKMGLIEKTRGPHPSGRALNCLYIRPTENTSKMVNTIKNAGVPSRLLDRTHVFDN